MMNKNAKLLIGLACLSLGLTACEDDYFDLDAYDAKVKEAFPVKDIDPAHTWATYGSANAYVTVNGDYGETYRVAVYKENPLFTSPVTLLSSNNNVKSGQTAKLTFSFPLASPMVYVACFDKDNRRVIKSQAVTDGKEVYINFFGNNGFASRPQRQFDRFNSYTSRATRAEGKSEDIFNGNESMGYYSAKDFTLTDSQKELFKEGNILGVDFTIDKSIGEYFVNVYAGWTSLREMTLTENQTNVEIVLSDNEAQSIINDQLKLICKGFYLNRVYISEYTQATGSGNEGGGSGNEGGNSGNENQGGSGNENQGGSGNEGSGSSSGNTNFSETYTPLSPSEYQKGKETKLSVSDWVNASWIDHEYVDMSTIDSSSNFHTLNADSISQNAVSNDKRTNKWWRIESGTTIDNLTTQNFNIGNRTKMNQAIVYVKGKLIIGDERSEWGASTDYAVTYIVGNGGEIEINCDLHVEQGSRIVVMEGGKLTINNNSKLSINEHASAVGLYNASNITIPGILASSDGEGSMVYNVGTMTLNELEGIRHIYNYGTLNLDKDFDIGGNDSNTHFKYQFYNEGTCYVTNATTPDAVNYGILNGTQLTISDEDYYNKGSSVFTTICIKHLVNEGHLVIDENIDIDNERWTLNSCYLRIKKSQTPTTGFRRLVMLQNSRIDLDGDCYFQEANNSYMEDKSMLNVGGKFVVPMNSAVMYPPTDENEFAILKVAGNIEMGKWDAFVRPNDGNLYLDWAKAGTNAINYVSVDNWESKGLSDMIAMLAKAYVSEQSAPKNLIIPRGDCTGTGYTPGPGGDDFNETTESYRFCFEDYFPSPGDYDFNDCVITITPKVEDEVATVTVSLDAVGATKQLAAVMRIIGLEEEYVSYASMEASGTNALVDNAGAYKEYSLVKDTRTPDGWSNIKVVSKLGLNADLTTMDPNTIAIPLFNDAHWAMSGEGSGADILVLHDRFYNTIDPALNHARAYNNVAPKSMTFTFNFSRDSEKAQLFADIKNYDIFILENYDGRIWEVHTYPWKFDQVVGTYANDGNKLSLYKQGTTENFPWAIQVPGDFRYPVEWQSISGGELVSTDNPYSNFYGTTAAYEGFAGWAQNHNTNTNWYATPTNSSRVYPATSNQ